MKEHPYVIVGIHSATILVDDNNSEGAETNNDRSYAHTDLTTLKNPIRTNLRNEGTTKTNTAQGLNSFMLLPPSFLTEIKEVKTNVETVSAQEKLFKHATCSRATWITFAVAVTRRKRFKGVLWCSG